MIALVQRTSTSLELLSCTSTSLELLSTNAIRVDDKMLIVALVVEVVDEVARVDGDVDEMCHQDTHDET